MDCIFTIHKYIYIYFYRNKNIIPLKTQNIVSEIHAATVKFKKKHVDASVMQNLAYSKLVKLDGCSMSYRQVNPVYFKQITFENILIPMSEMEQIFSSPEKSKPCCN